MIKRLTIKNYKCFENQAIDLSNLTLLAGINGAGKSSVIQALLLLRQSQDQGLLQRFELALNGEYTQIGSAKDALFEKATADHFGFELSFTSGRNAKWMFGYNAVGDVVTSRETLVDDRVAEEALFGPGLEYLHAERTGPRTFFPTSDYQVRTRRHLGSKGEFTTHFLSYYGRKLKVSPTLHHNIAKSSDLIDEAEAWMSEICPGTRLHFTPYAGMDAINAEYSFSFGTETTQRYRATNVGFGLTYTLPVIVAALSAQAGSLLLIENPEAHLHPKGQVILGKLLSAAADQGVQIIIETHSDHILNGIRLSLHQGLTLPERIKLYYLRRELGGGIRPPSVTSIDLDSTGRLSSRPEGFFDEFNASLSQLLTSPIPYAGTDNLQ